MSVNQQGSVVVTNSDEAVAQTLVAFVDEASTSDGAGPHPHVTLRHNRSGVTEITSLLQSMYLHSEEEQHQSGDEGEYESEQFQELHAKIETLEIRLKESVDSLLNREEGLRVAIEAVAQGAREYAEGILQKFEQAVIACLKRRDEQWEARLQRVTRPQRVSWRPSGFSTPSPVVPPTPQSPDADVTITPTPTPVSAVSKKPPIKMEFPKFGESRNSTDFTEVIEQCGLSLKLLFLKLFCHLIIQQKLKSNCVQVPTQCLRDFAYDHQALCLKWRADMLEDEIVRRILNACNPRLASGLRDIVSTVEQLVKVGSLIEKDWGNSKDHWNRVQRSNPNYHSTKNQNKKAERGQAQAGEVGSVLGVPTLLVVPVAVRGSRGDAVVDTGCTYSLMSSRLWESIKKNGESLCSTGSQKFVMANGQESRAIGKVFLLLALNNVHYTLSVFVLEESQLCMPLLLGLDFLCTSQLTLKPHLGRYVMPGGKEFKFLYKTRDTLEWKHVESPALFYMAVVEDTTKHQPAVPLLEAQPEVVRPLLQKWPTVWTETTGSTNVIHRA